MVWWEHASRSRFLALRKVERCCSFVSPCHRSAPWAPRPSRWSLPVGSKNTEKCADLMFCHPIPQMWTLPFIISFNAITSIYKDSRLHGVINTLPVFPHSCKCWQKRPSRLPSKVLINLPHLHSASCISVSIMPVIFHDCLYLKCKIPLLIFDSGSALFRLFQKTSISAKWTWAKCTRLVWMCKAKTWAKAMQFERALVPSLLLPHAC